jgi:B12-binding domain/radical SAM domain protein
VETVQFIKVPIGMLSIAEYLDRHGIKTLVDNIGDRMTTIAGFDIEDHIKSSSASIFGIGMHFQQHAQGAVEVARLYKRLHPHSLVIMGGLTATRFHQEIIEKYPFIDAVVRGEGEKPLLQLVRAYEKNGNLTDTPNLTYRTRSGEVRITPMMPASKDLDDFEFTRFDLLEPKNSITNPDSSPRYNLAICRGCCYNCSICGGSAYTYKKYLGMQRPAFRSPSKLVEDIKRLNDQDVRFIGLFQDMRMAGQAYWQELIATLVKEKPQIERLSLDLLVPADEAFIKAVAKIGRQVIFHLCPDTGSDAVRKKLGRHYTSKAVIETVKTCAKYRIPVTNFFSVGLAGETEDQMRETWDLWAQLDEINTASTANGAYEDIYDQIPIGGQVLGPILIDPGSQAFDRPEKYGYKLIYKDLQHYIFGMSQPSWHQWLNYETLVRDKASILEMIFRSTEFTIDQREKYGFFGAQEAYYERCRVEADRVIVKEIDRIMTLENPREQMIRTIAIRKSLDELEKQRMVFIE